MQYGFYFDQTRCTGCGACIVACKDWHDIPAGPENWLKVTTIEKGDRQHLFVARMITPCYHCAQPACLSACPAGAIVKRPEDGIVTVTAYVCVGAESCGRCRDACPCGAPQFAAGDTGVMRKCDLCLERWAGDQKPICVLACPMRALDAGPLAQLREAYGEVREAEGFALAPELGPSILFKPKPAPAGRPGKPGRSWTIPLPPEGASPNKESSAGHLAGPVASAGAEL
jgi:anaerobic dimethyl sulfoxide reductase subunit B (iron-sulfur subunit)